MELALDPINVQPTEKKIQLTPTEFLEQTKTLVQIPGLVSAIATRLLIHSAAKDLGIEATPEELQAAADRFRQLNRLESASATFEWLQQHHLTLDGFEEFVCSNVLSIKVAEHLFEAKVEPYFYENQLQYEKVVLCEIVFDDEDLALEAFYSIQENESSFCAIARQYILDKELSRMGGYRGSLARSDLKPEISAQVFSVTPPTLLKPILTASGSHLIFVEEILPAQLTETLKLEIRTALFMSWLQPQIEQLKIEFLPSPAVAALPLS
jgi:parvulin-like peptidyl-prolyl isomerase